MPFLLDTNVLSEIRKKERASPNVRDWRASVSADELYLSVMALGEIRTGAARLRRRDPVQALVFEKWLTEVGKIFSERIVPVTSEVADTWGRLIALTPLPLADGLMAATAVTYGWTFVTRNTKHVERTGVSLLNPFEPILQ